MIESIDIFARKHRLLEYSFDNDRSLLSCWMKAAYLIAIPMFLKFDNNMFFFFALIMKIRYKYILDGVWYNDNTDNQSQYNNANTPWHKCHEVFVDSPFNALDSWWELCICHLFLAVPFTTWEFSFKDSPHLGNLFWTFGIFKKTILKQQSIAHFYHSRYA